MVLYINGSFTLPYDFLLIKIKLSNVETREAKYRPEWQLCGQTDQTIGLEFFQEQRKYNALWLVDTLIFKQIDICVYALLYLR